MQKLLKLGAPLAVALAFTLSGCGGDEGEDEPTTPTVAEGPILDGVAVARCLKKKGAEVGEPGADALLARYSDEAVKAGGGTFVVPNPVIHFIFFPEQVDLEEAEDELRKATARGGPRAIGLQADAYGNALVVYFVPEGAQDKTPVNDCLGGEAEAVPGFSVPFQPSGLAPDIID